MSKIRVAVVGAGFSGTSHLRALRQVPQVDIVAVVDTSPEHARAAAEQLGCAAYFDDYERMFREAAPDAIHNCTPNEAHCDVTLAALAHNVHVLSEKPLGMNGQETRTLVDAAQSTDVVTAVCFNYRYYPLVRETRATLAGDPAAAPHLVHGSYLQDWLLLNTDWNWRLESARGGRSRAVADIGSHWIDLVQFVVGQEVVEVTAQLGRLHDQRLRPVHEAATFSTGGQVERQAVAIDTEDFGGVLLRFASGCLGAMTVSQVSAGRKNSLQFEIDTPGAAFTWNQEDPNRLLIGRRGEPDQVMLRDPSLLTDGSRFSRLPAGHPEGWLDTLVGLFTDFYAAASAKQKGETYQASFATFEDGHRIELIMEAILESNDLHRAVTVGA